MRQFLTILSTFLVAMNAKSVSTQKGGCENSGFFVSDNTILETQDSIVYKDTSEDDCVKMCHANRDQFGRPIQCSSFSYDHTTFSCTIYKEKSTPSGSFEITSSAGKRYFEKVCLPQSLTQCSASHFIRVDQSVLSGYASNLTLVDSLELCVVQCIQEQGCLSAMYFYEDGECITNKESALTKPAAFSKEENDKVVYFQNGCDLTSKVETVETSSAEASGNSEEIVEEVITTTPESVPVTEAEEVTAEESEYEEEQDAEMGGEGEFEDEEEEVEEEETTTTTTTTTTTPKPLKSLKKIKKNPKNFASKTFKALKNEKSSKLNIQKVDESDEKKEEVETDYFSEWSDWTPCTKSQERQIRRRRCLNLRKCLGALMQVQNCPSIIPTTTPVNIESVRSVVNVNGDDYEDTSIPVVSEPIPQLLNEPVWGPWQGTCQHFASSQPCNSGNMIGFESRECIAKDPAQCEGPFFRYCTLSC